ncbi:hypothetical protein TEPIDINF_001345 [Tepidibacillus infernus]|uniref:hypothetical protein n=1 Tax=Tepidibacillus TaxID=1494427 RepID=UPI000853315D|nr:hypothetical protein [Tepidibacillus sp. HK-1]GBF12316.1 hypothetical protein HK1_02377 [Tepidibacillus sp. HK-1]
MNDSLKSLIQIYKMLDEAKLLIEDAINQIGVEQSKNPQSLPKDIQELVEVSLELTPEQRKTLMRFIESLK